MNPFFHSIKNTDPKQLLYRLMYVLKRKLTSSFGGFASKRYNYRTAEGFRVKDNFTLKYLSEKKSDIKKNGNEFIITFLNEPKSFSLPFDWNAKELNKGTRLWKLNLHYMEYLTKTNNSDFQLIVEDWINSNPPYQKDYALDNWNSYALSIRGVIWMREYILRKEHLNDNFKKKYLNSLYRQIQFLYSNPELDIGGNHVIKNIKALFWASDFFISKDTEKWRIKAEMLLDKELDSQILEDGMHYELSPSYHCQVFIDLLECFNAVYNESLKLKLISSLHKMVQVVADLSMQDGYIAQFSDGGYHMAASPAECTRAYKQITDRTVKQNKIFSLPQSGYYGIHKDDLDIVIDCGRIGADNLPAHGHGDIFSFELCLRGQRMIIDPGVFEYNAGDKRNYSRSTKAHNTVTLDDQDQGEFYSSFRLGRRADVEIHDFMVSDDEFQLTAAHNGFFRLEDKPLHKRKFKITGSRVVVEDSITGGARQKVKSRLLIHPACRIEIKNNEVYINYQSSEILLQTDSEISIAEVSWFPDFGVEKKTNQIVLDYGSAPCKGLFVITVVNNKIPSDKYLKSLQHDLSQSAS